MIKTWDDISNYYNNLKNINKMLLNMYNLVVSIKTSKYANHIFAWTSMYDLYIVQTIVKHPYDRPRLLIRPLENNQIELRYIDTYKQDRQWQRITNSNDAFSVLESFLIDIHWFYPNFVNYD